MQVLAYEGELPMASPGLIIPISEEAWQRKQQALACYGSQLSATKPGEPSTSIAGEPFARWIEARARTWGYQIGAEYGEALRTPLAPLRIGSINAFL